MNVEDAFYTSVNIYQSPKALFNKTVTFLLRHLQSVKSLTLRLLMTYTGCPRRKGPNFGRVFLMLKYTDVTQNTYIQSWTVTEITAREQCGLLAGLRNVPCQLTGFRMSVLDCSVRLQKYRWRGTSVLHYGWLCMSCIVLGTLKDNYDVSAGFFCSSI